jgi:plastocyanin
VLIKSSILPAGVAVMVGVVALALGSSRGGVSVAASSKVATGSAVSLRIANYAFAPAALTVKVGTRITVSNSDGTAHTATAGSGAFDSGTLKQGQSSHFTLKKAGTYTYICQFHAFMTGTIKVVG